MALFGDTVKTVMMKMAVVTVAEVVVVMVTDQPFVKGFILMSRKSVYINFNVNFIDMHENNKKYIYGTQWQ